MQRDLKQLESGAFDLVVVGGGIYGAAVAWEATLRGLSVALVERLDFGWATSANMHRIAHGGFRYLQNADFKRMRESIRERKCLMRIAPHLVRPLPFMVPTYRWGVQSRAAMRAALAAYDLISADRNRGMEDPDKHIGRGRLISREECFRLAPGLDQEGVTGAAVWFEGLVESPERLNLEFVLSAAERGACVANYVDAKGLLLEGTRVCGVSAVDVLTGDEIAVRGALVVNTCGPWTDELLAPVRGERSGAPMRLVRTINAVTRPLTEEDHGVAVNVPHVAMRGRHHDGCCMRYFLVPWAGTTITGSLDVLEDVEPGPCLVSADEVERLVERINAGYPGAQLTPDDVIRVHAGLIPQARKGPQDDPYNAERHYRLIDHRSTDGVDGLLTVLGIKFTTARDVAAKAVTIALAKLGRTALASESFVTPLRGGRFGRFAELVKEALGRYSEPIGDTIVRQVVRNHGAGYKEVLERVQEDRQLGERIGEGTEVLKAQVVHAVREEMAMKLSDVVLRRTELGTVEHPGADNLAATADLMSRELGWDHGRVSRELEEVAAELDRLWVRPKRSASTP